ncbi:RIO1 family regulatory kinase/ATPase [Comamonas sp. JC664]|uniref:RIO1 family regulatory kinase/ATPase domain-containing protein n=1 Tax=Comamonas sp. JC664 TaxID=2801917 RepID=UPI00174A5B7D|nr:RIO1 family regulatory kinase/ATPase [Comamonas sp. JC664]MBL0693144.1 hypothetical protein [Comamonas sp. JC664]GHG97000.1 hypothetical protein GCM10012319_61640 [Comamonas sp. KCTC 72670]
MNDSLETLLADGIIEAIIGQLKTGKEAEVWLVQHAGQVVAAKLYKERHERNFRNNAGYREGREVRNSRTRRAMEKGSRFGQNAAEDAWKSAESDSLYKLHAQGVRVPTPVMFYEGILLMEVVLDPEGHPAPRMVEAPPRTAEEAQAMYVDLRGQVINMLCADLIHGDLSPYNILMSYQGPTIIDFPQTVAAARNNRAEFYFRRDLDNVRNFLAATAPALFDAAGDTAEIWNAYVRRELTPDFTPSGNFREGARRNGRGGPRGQNVRAPREEVFVPEPAPVELAAPARDMTPEEAAEAELRELEALVLRQGGGERGKPAVAAPPPRGGRNRGFGGGRPPPRGGGGGNASRPAPNGQRAGGAGRTGPNEQRAGSGGPGRPGPNEQRPGGPGRAGPNNGAPGRGAPNEQRAGGNGPGRFSASNGGPGRAGPNEQRSDGPERSGPNEQRSGGGRRSGPNEQRAGGPGRSGPAEQRSDGNGPGRFSASNGGPGRSGPNEQRAEGPERSGPNEQRSGGGRRSGPNEQRAGGPGRSGPGEQRFGNGGPGRPGRNDPRTGASEPYQGRGAAGDSRQNDPRPGGNGRPPRGDASGGAFTSPSDQGPRGNGARPERNDRRGGPNGRQQPRVETRPAVGMTSEPPPNVVREPRQGNSGNNAGGPRQQRPQQGRGGARNARAAGPQVSYVARPASSSEPGPHETGS